MISTHVIKCNCLLHRDPIRELNIKNSKETELGATEVSTIRKIISTSTATSQNFKLVAASCYATCCHPKVQQPHSIAELPNNKQTQTTISCQTKTSAIPKNQFTNVAVTSQNFSNLLQQILRYKLQLKPPDPRQQNTQTFSLLCKRRFQHNKIRIKTLAGNFLQLIQHTNSDTFSEELAIQMSFLFKAHILLLNHNLITNINSTKQISNPTIPNMQNNNKRQQL